MDDIALSLQCLLVVEGLKTVHIVFKVEQMTLLFLIDYLLGREGGECFRIPVHHTESAIDESLVIEIHEHLDYTLTALLVHGEGGAVPVARSTQTAQLLQDDATMLVSPCPSVLQELFTGQVVFLDTLLSEFLHHFGFCSNRSVVCARHPECILTLHTGSAYEDVLDGVVQHVTHVEHTCHIGGRNHDCVGFTSIGFAGEKFVVQPILIPLSFDLFWVVFTC